MSGITVDESEVPKQADTVFAWSSKKRVALNYPDGRLRATLLTTSGHFSSGAAFSWPNSEQYLLELIVWFSRRTPFQSHHIHITFFG